MRIASSGTRFVPLALLLALIANACAPGVGDSLLTSSEQSDTTATTVVATRDERGRDAALLSAFFGLDDALPTGSGRVICPGADGADGMPVVFSHEIDPATLQAGDFRIATTAGRDGSLVCVTLAPANDPGELRTVLLVGDYGSADAPPLRVEVVGDLLSLDGDLNFRGSGVEVMPLELGPTLVWAEVVPEPEWNLGAEATPGFFGGGGGCPVAGTVQVVRATWAGGVTRPGGDEIGDAERRRYRVALRGVDGAVTEVVPFALGDLGDGDNNHELCLDVSGTPRRVSFPAGFLTDPREDLNPDTTIPVFVAGG